MLIIMRIYTWTAKLVDVKGAFFHGKFDNNKEIYTKVPQGIERFINLRNYVLLLKKHVTD